VCVFHTVMYVGEDNQENRVELAVLSLGVVLVLWEV
jgi:hypothetical protein